MSPALDFQDIEPKGAYITKSGDNALYNKNGESFASYSSGAKALKEEILNQKYNHKRFTIIEKF